MTTSMMRRRTLWVTHGSTGTVRGSLLYSSFKLHNPACVFLCAVESLQLTPGLFKDVGRLFPKVKEPNKVLKNIDEHLSFLYHEAMGDSDIFMVYFPCGNPIP